MTAQEIAVVLKLFKVAWPTMTVEDFTAHVWAEACHGVDGQDAVTAAKRLVRSEERPPSIARFREECKLVARNRQERIEPGPAVGALSHDETKARIQAIRRGYEKALKMIPKHDHHKGWEKCPACSTAEARRPAVLAAIRDELGAVRGDDWEANHPFEDAAARMEDAP